MPPVANGANIYADAGPGMLSHAVRGMPYRIYVPESGGDTVTVIDPSTSWAIWSYQTGLNPQAVTLPGPVAGEREAPAGPTRLEPDRRVCPVAAVRSGAIARTHN